MSQDFKNKIIIQVTYNDFNKETIRTVFPSQYASKEEFLDTFGTEIQPRELEGIISKEDKEQVTVFLTTAVVYYDEIKETHETETLPLFSNLLTLNDALSALYDFLSEIENRVDSGKAEKLSQDLNEIEEAGDELERILSMPDEDYDNDEISVYVEPEGRKIYSEAYMLGETDDRIANANADQLEDAKEDADPNTHLAHPTSSGTEEPLKTYTYSGDTTVEDTPAPATAKFEDATKAVVVVCTTLSLFFLTVILGIEAFHQVMSLF